MLAKRLLLILTVLCASFAGASAQYYNPYWQWAKADTPAALTYSGGTSVLGIRNGKILWGRITNNASVVAGGVWGTWTFSEYDSSGRQTASAAFGGKIQMIDAKADAAGNWYILGHFYDSLILPAVTIVHSNPTTDPDPNYFILRLDAGSFYMSWWKLIGATRAVQCHAMTIDNSKIILAADSSDATYVESLPFSGGAFTKMFKQGGVSRTTSIVTDASGNIYMAGSCANKGSLDFNGIIEPLPTGVNSAYIARYLATYANAWHYIMADPMCDERQLTLFQNRFLYYTGSLHDSLAIGTKTVHKPIYSMDFVSAELDPISGTVNWIRQVDTGGSSQAFLGYAAYHAAITPDTALVVFSQGNSYVNWGNNVSTNLFGSYSSVVVSTGSDGNTRWAMPVLADNVTDDRIVSEDKGVYVSGSAYTNTAFTRFDTLNLKMPARKWVPYLAKLNLVRPKPVQGGNGVANVWGGSLSAAPNPAKNTVQVAGLSGKSTLVLRDVSGRIVLEQTTEKTTATLNVADLPRGLYMLELSGSEKLPEVRKILLQ